MKRTLRDIVLSGALILFSFGCENNSKFGFYGRIDDEELKFYEGGIGYINILEVKRKDNTSIIYGDNDGDHLLDYVEIKTTIDSTTYYKNNNSVTINVLEKAQAEYEAYLSKIRDFETASSNNCQF